MKLENQHGKDPVATINPIELQQLIRRNDQKWYNLVMNKSQSETSA